MRVEGRHRSVYATRARLGLIVPPTNSVNESEWARMLPPGVGMHVTRMRLHADSHSESGKAALWADLAQAIGLLVPVRPDAIAYACTAGSMLIPPEQVADRMRGFAGVPCVSTAFAIVQALRSLGVRRVAVATPYHDALNRHETEFLAACGFEVTKLIGLGIGAGGAEEYIRIAQTPIAEIEAHARAAMTDDADALLISCTDFPTLPLITALEAEFARPVISSNTATLWASLRAAGIEDQVPAGGKLFG